jgi:4-cresol dehydrogenase (hydroxylating) flavoprotein subunit
MSTTVSPAIEELAGALGAAAVLTSDEDLREFRDPFAHATWDDYAASAVVMPDSFGDHAYLRFCETIKDALDPNGILAPGKSGIWPKSMREAR